MKRHILKYFYTQTNPGKKEKKSWKKSFVLYLIIVLGVKITMCELVNVWDILHWLQGLKFRAEWQNSSTKFLNPA